MWWAARTGRRLWIGSALTWQCSCGPWGGCWVAMIPVLLSGLFLFFLLLACLPLCFFFFFFSPSISLSESSLSCACFLPDFSDAEPMSTTSSSVPDGLLITTQGKFSQRKPGTVVRVTVPGRAHCFWSSSAKDASLALEYHVITVSTYNNTSSHTLPLLPIKVCISPLLLDQSTMAWVPCLFLHATCSSINLWYSMRIPSTLTSKYSLGLPCAAQGQPPLAWHGSWASLRDPWSAGPSCFQWCRGLYAKLSTKDPNPRRFYSSLGLFQR